MAWIKGMNGDVGCRGREGELTTPMDRMDRILDSGLRRNDGSGGQNDGFGGMAVGEGRGDGMDKGDEWGFWMPACAGMTVLGE